MPQVRPPIRQSGIIMPTCLSIVYIIVRYERFAGGKDCDMTMETPFTKSGKASILYAGLPTSIISGVALMNLRIRPGASRNTSAEMVVITNPAISASFSVALKRSLSFAP